MSRSTWTKTKRKSKIGFRRKSKFSKFYTISFVVIAVLVVAIILL